MTQVTGDSRLQSDVLEELSDALRYRRWLAALARPYLGAHPIEIGSGIGDYALEWIADCAEFTATEADSDRLAALRQRLGVHPKITVRYLLLGDPSPTGGPESAPTHPDAHDPDAHDPDVHDPSEDDPAEPVHSAAVAFNVLEHIPDDVGALRAAARLVRPGGAVVLIVPAFPSAMSRFDHAIGHQRRYTRASLAAALTSAGLSIEILRYVNPLGLLSWYLGVKVLRLAPHNGPVLRIYDRTVVPLARIIDRLPMPLGQSVFAVARVPSRPG